MDVDHTHAPNTGFRGRQTNICNTQMNSQTLHNSNGACFNCRQQGHFVQNCPNRQRINNVIDKINKEDDISSYEPIALDNCIKNAYNIMMNLNAEEQLMLRQKATEVEEEKGF